MAAGGDDVKPTFILQSQISQDTQSQNQDKSAGLPLSDFVLQLEDYAPTV